MGQVFTIPPDQPFVDALAQGLLDEAGDAPERLIDGLVLLPTRRACRSLRDAFLRAGGGRPMILPRIQPLGEVEAEELLAGGAVEVDLPPAIGRLRRQLLLARLLQGYDRSMPVEHRLRLADELALLLDELASERRSLGALERLVPDDLSQHWAATRVLLGLVHRHWPAILEEEGALDPAERRNRLLDGFARQLAHDRPDRRIVAAGSTGSIDATRGLLRAVLAVPRGAVVLPGLDLELDAETWERLPPSHPQAGLRQLLAALEQPRDAVLPWLPADPGAGAGQKRILLLREAMRPATARRPVLDVGRIEAGRSGLEIQVLPDLAGEASALALRMRAALEQPGRTAMLVTPDRSLARRVAVELRRWAIEIDDSAGVPLDQTRTGGFLLLAARLLDGVTAVPLLALMKHPFLTLGRAPGQVQREIRGLERTALRGPRISGGLPGILTELHRLRDADQRDRPERADAWRRRIALVEELAGIVAPFLALAARASVGLDELVRAHVGMAERLGQPPRGHASRLWAGEAGEAAADLLREILDGARDGHPIPPGAYPALLAQLMADRPVRARAPRHPRLAIYGQLEARLQHADLVLIGGLNEGVWPPALDPGPWLNRAMREAVGLAPAERRIGLAAHDLQQLAAAETVVLSRAERDAAGNPTVPSRWLVRLQALLAAAPAPPPTWWADWAAGLDLPAGPATPAPPPRPTPPPGARPRALSVSDIGAWMRDPYALYAKRVLRLKPLAPLEQDPGALERGIMVHEVLEAFVRRFPDVLPGDALTQLLQLGTRAFQAFTHRPLVRRLWWPRFEQAARWYLEQERARRPDLARLMVEVAGAHRLDGPGGPFVLNARADRIERDRDGRLTVIDYKTGALPKDAEVTSGRQPQLPLEALMVRAGAFDGIGPAEVAGLWFWSLRGHATGGEAKPLKGEPERLAQAALAGLTQLIEHYDDPTTSYPARLRPDMSQPRDYDHLARFKEWAG